MSSPFVKIVHPELFDKLLVEHQSNMEDISNLLSVQMSSNYITSDLDKLQEMLVDVKERLDKILKSEFLYTCVSEMNDDYYYTQYIKESFKAAVKSNLETYNILSAYIKDKSESLDKRRLKRQRYRQNRQFNKTFDNICNDVARRNANSTN